METPEQKLSEAIETDAYGQPLLQPTTLSEPPKLPKLTQKNAVFNFVTEAIHAAGKSRIEGQPLKALVTKEIRKVVRQRLYAALQNSEIRMATTMDDSKLKKYCSGLINNWLKKDTRFN